MLVMQIVGVGDTLVDQVEVDVAGLLRGVVAVGAGDPCLVVVVAGGGREVYAICMLVRLIAPLLCRCDISCYGYRE